MLQRKTSPFFNPKHFADKAEFSGVQAPVYGIFDDAAAVGDVGGLGMGTTHPTLLLTSQAVPADVRGRMVQVAGQCFSVEDIQPDGPDLTLLVLEVRHV